MRQDTVMFLRRNRRAVDGQTCEYWTVARSVRTAKGPRQVRLRVVARPRDKSDVDALGGLCCKAGLPLKEVGRFQIGAFELEKTRACFDSADAGLSVAIRCGVLPGGEQTVALRVEI